MNFKIASPQNKSELLHAIAALQGTPFRFGAGYTDLLMLLEKKPIDDLTIINLAGMNDARFNSIESEDGGIRIGALVTANMIIDDAGIATRVPVLADAASQHASRQIRQVATIGGNLCTASPAGDMACALVALQAECEILSTNGTVRTNPIDKFFTGVRKTDLHSDEILQSVFIPLQDDGRVFVSRFFKVGTRLSMECAIASLACHIVIDDDNRITHAGIAIGSVAPVITFVASACEFLMGRRVDEIDGTLAAEFAANVVAYASPITDIRGSAWYRKQVLINLSKSVFENEVVF